MNIQASCEASCRFTFFAVAAPGKSSDQAAIERSVLSLVLDDLPLGTYIVGDAAYTLTDKCLTPFTGSQRSDPTKDTNTFLLSQVRIRIEMAFGLLTTMWQLLKQPLSVSLSTATDVLECISCLHNFCINMRTSDLTNNQEIEEIIQVKASPLGWGYFPTVEEFVHQRSLQGSSQVQDAILCLVLQKGFGRPAHNIKRQHQELHEVNLM